MASWDFTSGIFQFQRDYESHPYWFENEFWPVFIENENFDHMYFLDTVKIIFGDPTYRRFILQHLLSTNTNTSTSTNTDSSTNTSPNTSPRPGSSTNTNTSSRTTLLCNQFEHDESETKKLQRVRETVKVSKQARVPAYITFRYPIVSDESDHLNSHYIILVSDPVQKKVFHIDSRGRHYVEGYHRSWLSARSKLQQIFKDYRWVDVMEFDMQEKAINDNFCQIWSLYITIAFEQRGREEADIRAINELLRCEDIFTLLIDFLRRVVRIPVVSDAIYYEIYRMTHNKKGEKVYHRYFTALEQLVSTGLDKGYCPNQSYEQQGLTFIEDFFDALDSDRLKRLLL